MLSAGNPNPVSTSKSSSSTAAPIDILRSFGIQLNENGELIAEAAHLDRGCDSSQVEKADGTDSDTDSQAHLSDDEDIFNMRCAEAADLPQSYRESNSEKVRLSLQEVCEMIRADPLLPLKPSSASDVIDDVDTPVLWPSWHCPFQNCAECGLVRYEKNNEAEFHEE